MAHHVQSSAGDFVGLDTELVDLSEYSVDDILAIPGYQLAPYLDRTLLQVERPRMNLGGSGPPGRAD
jgi:hypothetical protein